MTCCFIAFSLLLQIQYMNIIEPQQSFKSRMRVKCNTRVKNVLPLAKARESLSDRVQQFELTELQRGRDARESGFNEAQSRPIFQVASFVVNFSAAPTSWRWSNIHFVSKHETLLSILTVVTHVFFLSLHLAAFPAAAQNDLQ